MSDPTLNRETLEAELVAYLDGELDAEASRRIEDLLASEPKVQRWLAELDGTWRLLDSLDTSSVDDRFTRTTMEMAVQVAAEEVQQVKAETPRRQRRALWGVLGGLAVAAGVAFVAAALARPDPDRELLENLPVIENLDQYVQADDIDFLRLLHEQGLFASESEDGK